jgi:hypothetical protein
MAKQKSIAVNVQKKNYILKQLATSVQKLGGERMYIKCFTSMWANNTAEIQCITRIKVIFSASFSCGRHYHRTAELVSDA